MFCKNCGNKMDEGDLFCGNCGSRIGGDESLKISKVNNFILIKFMKTYFTKPLSFFSEFKGEDTLKISIGLLLGLPIIYGLLNILYNSSLINAIIKFITKVPDLLAKIHIITAQDAIDAKKQLLLSNDFLNIKDKVNTFIDNKDIFLNGLIQMLAILILTGVILAILNAIILKNNMKNNEIIFISTASYIPLMLGIVLSSVATYISIIFGIFLFISGYILSFISLYSGIRQVSLEKNDKVFILMTVLFISISAILSIFILKEFENSILTISNIFEQVKHFI